MQEIMPKKESNGKHIMFAKNPSKAASSLVKTKSTESEEPWNVWLALMRVIYLSFVRLTAFYNITSSGNNVATNINSSFPQSTLVTPKEGR